MKIGLVTHYMPPHSGGIEQVAEALFHAYSAEGFHTRWVASRVPADSPAREDERVRVPCWNILERKLQVPVPLWGWTGWQAIGDLVRWADALHVHGCLYPGSAMGVLLAQRDATPVVLSQHVGFVPYRQAMLNVAERVAYRTLGRWVLRRVSRLVLATPAAEIHVARLLSRMPPHSVSIRNGIDTERFHPPTGEEQEAARRRLGVPQGQKVVLFAGRLVEKKGIRIVAEVSQRLRSAHFLVVGDGPLSSLIPRESANLTWHRHFPPAEMPACYHAADCLLLPSHGEGLPLVVQEAMASGLPVIVTEGEPYADALAQHGVCASATRSASEMVAELTRALDGCYPQLSRKAREFAQAQWSVAKMAAAYVALIRDAVARGR